MPARINTKKDVTCDHDDLLTWLENPICVSDPDQFSEFLELFTIEEEQTLIKPGASELEQHVIDWINEFITEGTYSTPQDVVSALMEHGGCNTGMATHLVLHTETYQFYTDYRFEIEEAIMDLYDGRIPDQWLDDGWQSFYDKVAWAAFEVTAQNLINEAYNE